jgi:hypothetical protein
MIAKWFIDMACVTIKIDTGGANFKEDEEIPYILRDLTKQIKREGVLDTWLYGSELRDTDGNVCGEFSMEQN